VKAGDDTARAESRKRWGTQDDAFAFAAAYRCALCGALAQVTSTVSVRHYPSCPRWRPPSQVRTG
jgi:hypothetical protein